MSNKAELLKKIKTLADRGVDGERESAQTLLTRLMEQYGISETEIEEERRETAWFPYSQETERRLLNQIIYMVTGAGGFGCVGEYSGRKRKKMGTECTAAERLEIEANYAFFKEAMKKELEIFYSAFANKNNLFPPADKVKPRSIEELSPEEKAYYAKVGLMAEGMERHTLRKAMPRAKPSKGGSHMQRAIQNTQAATRRRSRPLRVAGSTLTANVAFAVLKYAALTVAGVLLFRWGQGYALAERGYEAIGGEALLLGLPLFWYLTETTIRDTVRDFQKGGRRK